jgi:IPT/TIG domain/Abnormal spindle-like microcephaly-assoc'd, ASPM-SPD-2-Hydin
MCLVGGRSQATLEEQEDEVTYTRKSECGPLQWSSRLILTLIRGTMAVVTIGASLAGFGILMSSPAGANANVFLITPTSLNFGNVPVGTTSASQTVTVTNESSSTVNIDEAGGVATGEFNTVADCGDADVAPQQSCTYNFSFAPSSAGSVSDTVTGTLNGQAFSVTLTGTGTNDFLVTPTALNFGDVAVGQTSATQSVMLTNETNSSIVNVQTQGAVATGAFSTAEACNGLTLESQQSCYFYFSFAPTAVGATSETTSGTINGQPFSVVLTGTGVTQPVVNGVTPDSGPPEGGTNVTITGTGFTDASSVEFGSTAATSFNVVSDTEITAVSPQSSSDGVVAVTVSTAAGTSGSGASGQFTYVIGPPDVTSVSPSSGSTAGGTAVTIDGLGFGGTTSVLFGTVSATSFNVVSSGEITAISPSQSAGTDNIYVVTPDGESGTSASDDYTYTAASPTITSISPTSGPEAGGTTVTITGTGLSGATAVTVGGKAVTSFSVIAATQISAVTPALGAGSHGFQVTTPDGTSSYVSADLFAAIAGPAITSISPNSGPPAGGTTVTVTGTGFTGATKLTIGGVSVSNFTVVSSTEITFVTPALPAGSHGIAVTTTYGTSAYVSGDVFTVT